MVSHRFQPCHRRLSLRPRARSAILAALLAALCPALLATERHRSFQRVESRWALIIGNSDYTTGQLRNPLHDARDVAAVLGELGFAVELLENAGHQAMEDAIRAFSRHLQAGEVGVFYFAGHGVQVDNENYLIPAGARISGSPDVPYKSVNLRYVLDHMGEAPDRLNIVILDACRDNPWSSTTSRSVNNSTQGLAQTDAPTGTIIAYATAPGHVADDGNERNGIFTQYLLEALRVEGLTIEEVFKRTRQSVVRATAGRQVPWTSSSLLGDFVPRPEVAGRNPIRLARIDNAGPSELPREPPAPPADDGFSLENLDDKAIEFEQSRKAWEDHLGKMTAAFDKVDHYEERNVPAHLKAEAWDHFLDSFAAENPYTRADNSLRSDALTRRDLWRREAERISSGLRPHEVRPLPQLPSPEPGTRWQEPITGSRFRYVPGDLFCMGSRGYERGRERNETFHDVELTQGFWMAETEVTQGEWWNIVGSAPAYFRGCESCPVERVSWFEAVAFANRLSEAAGYESCYELRSCRGTLGGGCAEGSTWCFGDFVCSDVWYKGPACSGYRLPTEAEWEYAARAGSTSAFSTGDRLTLDDANFQDNRYERLHNNRSGTSEVARFEPNDWGLYDVHGNVLEWVWDYFGPYPRRTISDPEGPWDGSRRVVRGGGWKDPERFCRSATRRSIDPGNRFDDVGFRLVRSAR